ncbi:ketose-bisphosphate aldolase [Lacrimispora sp. NSJ-141]|uniref:Ketose-bisphosphate aldolase n=1 Tax=Lientehia hominis TaxID=2897778 RepID=A0AAP2RI32_9FIRM|nr:ketose-bisphosphate aldolase [Lientehia hominis]MCD2492020.1 ketose-bisphosphate aldolase [Lientehia hominis]
MLMNMADLLAVANEHNFAVPAFNVSSSMILKGVMHTCEEMQAPVIIAIHPDELEFVEDSFVKAVIDEANKTTVPVCIHLDHGAKFEQILRAIRDGFTSVMIDASSLPLEENIAITKKVIEVAHPLGVSVEAELGTIGTADDYGEAGSKKIIYTEVDDAVKFVKETGVDCLAIAIGTAHGLYPKDRIPELKLDRLKEIKANVSIPLVLHGGSGNPDKEIGESVKLGVNKINISSDIKDAFYQECRKVLEDKGLREPMAIYPKCIDAMNEVVRHKINLFDDADKVKYYYE